MKRFWYVLKWIKITWHCAPPWDYAFLLEMMIEKLKEMEIFFTSEAAMTESAKDKAQEMRLFRKSLERILDNNYLPEERMTRENIDRANELLLADLEFAGNQFKKVVEWWD